MEKWILNLTPHEVVMLGEDGEVIATFPPSGKVARVDTSRRLLVNKVNGIPVYRPQYGEVVNLPEEEAGTILIVSFPVLLACRRRRDIVSPDTTPEGVMRDEKGQVKGVKGFQIL